ncbi:MAG: D-sedoheptulose 7-phosphate isomerase [Pararobbsia sp.]
MSEPIVDAGQQASLEREIRAEFAAAAAVLDTFMNDAAQLAKIAAAARLLADTFDRGGKAISCGNGGSHCDAMHFAEELTGRFRDNRKGFAAIAISDVSHISCVGNDFGFDFIFSRYVEAVGRAGDVLLAISTSGNSKNVIHALRAARQLGMQTIALTGKDGGAIAREGLADVEIRVPHAGYADRVQEIHIKVIHTLILLVEKLAK